MLVKGRIVFLFFSGNLASSAVLVLQGKETTWSCAEQKDHLLEQSGGMTRLKEQQARRYEVQAAEPVRTPLGTTAVEMGAQAGPRNVATTVTDMTSTVPMLGHHLCKIQDPRRKGESDELRLGHMPVPRERSDPSM